MENRKLESGDEYLSIIILNNIKVAAFKNKQKNDPKQPDYIGNGVAVWKSSKK